VRYRWYRDGKPIGKSVRKTYRVKRGDRGHRITVVVTGTRPDYLSATSTSAAVRVRK